jgi:hypothetical protein
MTIPIIIRGKIDRKRKKALPWGLNYFVFSQPDKESGCATSAPPGTESSNWSLQSRLV